MSSVCSPQASNCFFADIAFLLTEIKLHTEIWYIYMLFYGIIETIYMQNFNLEPYMHKLLQQCQGYF